MAMSAGLDSLSVSFLAIDPRTPASLYAGTDKGAFKSTDGAVSWMAANMGLPVTRYTGVTVDPKTPQTLFAATADGVFKTRRCRRSSMRAPEGLMARSAECSGAPMGATAGRR